MAEVTAHDDLEQQLAEQLARIDAIVDDPHLSRSEKERALDEITGEGALTLAVMLDETSGDDV